MVYGVFSQAERGQSEKGLADTLEKAGLKVDRLEITQEVNSDTSLAVPVLAAYIQAHPNLKAIGTQHGGITGMLAEVLKKAGKKPGDIVVGGIDLAPGDDRRAEVGLRLGDARPAPLPAGLHAGPAVRDDARSTRCRASSLNTGAGTVTPKTIDALVELIDAGIR